MRLRRSEIIAYICNKIEGLYPADEARTLARMAYNRQNEKSKIAKRNMRVLPSKIAKRKV